MKTKRASTLPDGFTVQAKCPGCSAPVVVEMMTAAISAALRMRDDELVGLLYAARARIGPNALVSCCARCGYVKLAPVRYA